MGAKRTRGRPKYQAVLQRVSHGGCLWGPMKKRKGMEVEIEAGLLASFPFISVLLQILLEGKDLWFESLKITALVTGLHLLDCFQNAFAQLLDKHQ